MGFREPNTAEKYKIITKFGKTIRTQPNHPLHQVEVNHIWQNGGIPIDFKKEHLNKMRENPIRTESIINAVKSLKERGMLLEYLTKIGPDKRNKLLESIGIIQEGVVVAGYHGWRGLRHGSHAAMHAFNNGAIDKYGDIDISKLGKKDLAKVTKHSAKAAYHGLKATKSLGINSREDIKAARKNISAQNPGFGKELDKVFRNKAISKAVLATAAAAGAGHIGHKIYKRIKNKKKAKKSVSEGLTVNEFKTLLEDIRYLNEKGGKWIQKAVKHPGALHKALGVPEDEKIPASKLQPKPGDSEKMKHRKALAKTFRKMKHEGTLHAFLEQIGPDKRRKLLESVGVINEGVFSDVIRSAKAIRNVSKKSLISTADKARQIKDKGIMILSRPGAHTYESEVNNLYGRNFR